MSVLLALLLACAPDAPPAAGLPDADLDGIEAWLRDGGATPVRTADVIRFADGDVEVRVQVDPAARLVLLSTAELITLRDTSDERGIVLLLTRMATENYALAVGKLQLNPATGGVTLTLELETDDGLGRATFEHAVRRLVEGARDVTPKLRASATATAGDQPPR